MLNTKKTKLMTFCRSPIYFNELKITALGEPIEHVNSFKFLGITFDNKLTFAEHANNVINTARFYNYKFKRSFNFLSQHAKKILFSAFISSRFEYGNLIWFPHVSDTVKKKLVQQYNSVMKTCCVQGKVLTLTNVHKFQLLKFNFEYIHKLIPAGLVAIMPPQSGTHKYNTRNKSTPIIPKHTSKKFNESFLVKGPILWQRTNPGIKNIQSYTTFKKRLYKKLLN